MPPGSCDQAARIGSPERNSCPITPTCEFIYDLEGRCHTAVRGDRSVAEALDSTSLPIRDTIGISAGTSEILRQRRRNPFHVCVGEWKFSPVKIVSPEPSLLPCQPLFHSSSARELPGRMFAKKFADLTLHLRSFWPKLNQVTGSIDRMKYRSGDASGHGFGS
jgi:hypothetical protein